MIRRAMILAVALAATSTTALAAATPPAGRWSGTGRQDDGTASARGPLQCADQWWGYAVRHQ
ncbi:MAG: hypothetical protein ACLP01_00130 [Solirubrobacteraceae bacterium]